MKKNKRKETIERLGELGLVEPAKEILDSVIKQTEALDEKKLTSERRKNLRVALGFWNVYLRAFSLRLQFFKLSNLNEKIKFFKKKRKK